VEWRGFLFSNCCWNATLFPLTKMVSPQAGTAWFWFTVMTTVGESYISERDDTRCSIVGLTKQVLPISICKGYGNQAPATKEGRSLVYTVGLLNILLFAGILGYSGWIIGMIFDDTMSKCKLKCFTTPVMGMILYFALWFGWMGFIGKHAYNWWGSRLPGYEVSPQDSFWFAYISTTTVGLGDFFLQPEVIFVGDVLNFSLLFLVGFVFAASFLGKLGGLISSMLPKGKEDSLEDRLKRTNLFFGVLVCKKTKVNEEDDTKESDALDELHTSTRVARLNKLFKEGGGEEVEEGYNDDMDLSAIEEEEAVLKALMGLAREKRLRLRAPSTLLTALDDNLVEGVLGYLDPQELQTAACCCLRLRQLSNRIQDEAAVAAMKDARMDGEIEKKADANNWDKCRIS
jgi:hypothetical protein